MLFLTQLPHIQVYGSIHLWDDSSVLLSNEAAEAYRAAERIVFEIDYRVPFDPRLCFFQEGQRLDEVLPADLSEQVRAKEQDFGLKRDGIENLKPWAAALFHILPHQFRKAGFTNARGIDARFFEQALTDGKSIHNFETLSGQLTFFDNAPDSEQEIFLRRAISSAAVEEAAKLFAAYRGSDIEAMEAIVNESVQLMPQLYTVLIEERNISWKQKILEEFNDGVPTLIVVGVLHCIGPTAVQNF